MPLHPCQHLIHLSDFPGMARRAAISQQRIRLVQNKEGAKIGGLLESGGDGLSELAEKARRQFGIALVQNLQAKLCRQMARIGRLSGARRS